MPVAAAVAEAVSVPLAVLGPGDPRTDAELARQLQAFRAGTLGFYKSDGTPLRPHLVPRTADELLEALK